MSQLPLTEEQRDCLQEVTNVAMGQAADRLARLLDAFVVLSIPHVNTLAPTDIAMALEALSSQQGSVSGVCQGFIGGGFSGEAMLIFNDGSFADLAQLMQYDEALTPQTEHELLMDASNVLIGGCMKSLAQQLDTQFSQGAPILLGQHCDIQQILTNQTMRWKQALVVELNYKIENYNINCDLLLVMSEHSIRGLLQKLDYLID